jgi:hypothetical protein
MENNNELFELLDSQAKSLVGILLKRIEILEKENSLTPSLYKAIVKEHVYEWVRTLKALITIGKVEFRTRPKE